jgi:serine/alanine adding enzyme
MSGALDAGRLIDDRALPRELCPDVYFTAGYGAAAALLRGGRWQCARLGDRVLVPYVVNALADGRCDAVSPFGFSGVYVAPDCPVEDLARFWADVRQRWREQGMVALYLRFSPLDSSSTNAVRGLDGLSLAQRNETITIPVGNGLAEVWGGLRSSCRSRIRKARRVGLGASVRAATAEDLSAGSAFRTLYAQTMGRVGAPDHVFGDAYYTALLDGVGSNLMIAEVREPDGLVVAAALVLVHRERVHYHLAGSDRLAGFGCANNLLVWAILEWAAENGRSVMHFGGGVRPGDSLFRFKSTFGGTRTPVWHGSAVIDAPAYDALVGRHAAALGMSTQELRDRGYFPAYRYGAGLI